MSAGHDWDPTLAEWEFFLWCAISPDSQHFAAPALDELIRRAGSPGAVWRVVRARLTVGEVPIGLWDDWEPDAHLLDKES
jgi:hypothetical protein